MNVLELYRGIAVPSAQADFVIHQIRSRGLTGQEGTKFVIPDIVDVRKQIGKLLMNQQFTADDIFKACPFPGICACGSAEGATYYATRHNITVDNDLPLIVRFSATADSIYIDCRDFLCAAFQGWDSRSRSSSQCQAEILAQIFGSGILRYFSKACDTYEQRRRIALCNLASFDLSVVKDHYKNRIEIHGRYGTRFTSAFFVKAPIAAANIISVKQPSNSGANDLFISLDDFYEGQAPHQA